jgi:urease accessory protein
MTNATLTLANGRSLQGCLSLRFAHNGERTVLAEAERSPPFHVQRLLYLDACRPALAHAAILNTTAGLCAGDRLVLTIRVQHGAAVEVTTPTSTRVFSMGSGEAESQTHIIVESGGYLEYVARPVILCRDAALRLRTRVDVDQGGIAAIGEVLAFGRVAAGECHAYRSLDQRTDLTYAECLILTEALRLTREQSPDATGVLGRSAAYGTLHLLGIEPDTSPWVMEVREILGGLRGVVGGVSILHTGSGLAVRLLGDRPHAVYEALRSVAVWFRGRLAPGETRRLGPSLLEA